jgi:type IV pilus assembly PilX-like protein
MTRHRSIRRRGREKGIALFVAILLLLVVTVMGIALMLTASFENTLIGTENRISKIFYAADSGIEYGAAMLNSTLDYTGSNPMPGGVSSYYPGSPTADMVVTIAPPVFLGYSLPPGEQIQSEGKGYGSSQVVENFYALTSSARSTKIEASKTIDAEIGVYPKLLGIPEDE